MIYELTAEYDGTVVKRTCWSEREYNACMGRVLQMGGTWWFSIHARPERPRLSPHAHTITYSTDAPIVAVGLDE